jgi:hypothetical protein
MNQVNFRIDDITNKFLEFMADMEKKTKSAISKEIFQDGLKTKMMPYLANLYKEGKISIKNIAYITGIHHTEIYHLLPDLIDDIDMDDSIIAYSREIGKKLRPYLQELQKKGVSFDKGIILGKK